MKASELIKVSLTAKQIYDDIEMKQKHESGVFKHFYPHWIYISESVIYQLINDGFKVSIGQWDHTISGTIIEW